MDFIEDFEKSTNSFTKKIKESTFVECNNTKLKEKGFKDITEVIIGSNEIEYSSIDKGHRDQFIVNKKLEIASTFKKNEKYNKKFSVQLVHNGFQHKNYLSTILYLNIYYKIHCIIYNHDTNKFYQTTLKDYPKLVCSYKNDTWSEMKDEIPGDIKYSDINELKHVITIDIDWLIDKPYLSVFSKYKLVDLESIATMNMIELKKMNKKKTKKELYDEINLKYYKQDI